LKSFDGFGLNDAIARAIAEEKYTTPTPIQNADHRDRHVPPRRNRDRSNWYRQTAAFALPILHLLAAHPRHLERKECRVLVLSPTRELSGQILESFRAYGRHLRIQTALAIGGVPMGGQVRALLCGVDVLVATPGRLLDLVKSNALRLGCVEFLVLDEADRMLDMGFAHDIRKIVIKIRARRQTLLFSATMPGAIAQLAARLLRDPVRVAVTPAASTVERIEQRIVHVDRGAKAAALVDVSGRETVDRALIFTRTKHGADKVVRGLIRAGITAEAIHGNKSQGQRERVLAAFRRGDVRTLVATDIAARGIDVDGMSHVVNFDLPNVAETYVHRIGRTARAGADGIAISLCDREELPLLRDIEKLIGKSIPASGEKAPAARARCRTPTTAPARFARTTAPISASVRTATQRVHAGSRGKPANRLTASPPSPSCALAPHRPAKARRPYRVGAPIQKDHDMAKEELLQFDGPVTEICPMPGIAFRSTADMRSSPIRPDE
jgi:ATP-dependent RNA helicase RhlE